jgi:hypothetical protein
VAIAVDILPNDSWALQVQAPGGLSHSTGLNIYTFGRIDTGMYFLGLDPLGHGLKPNAEYNQDENHHYVTTNDLPAWVHITRLDTVHNIVSGTFAMDMAELWTPDTVHITEGRFDWTFKR